MIDRRTFLKLSAGALVLTAAGALTGCGGMNDRPKVTIDGVVFMCEAPSMTVTGGQRPCCALLSAVRDSE